MDVELKYNLGKYASRILHKKDISKKLLSRGRKKGNLSFLNRNKNSSRLEITLNNHTELGLTDQGMQGARYGTPIGRYDRKKLATDDEGANEGKHFLDILISTLRSSSHISAPV